MLYTRQLIPGSAGLDDDGKCPRSRSLVCLHLTPMNEHGVHCFHCLRGHVTLEMLRLD